MREFDITSAALMAVNEETRKWQHPWAEGVFCELAGKGSDAEALEYALSLVDRWRATRTRVIAVEAPF